MRNGERTVVSTVCVLHASKEAQIYIKRCENMGIASCSLYPAMHAEAFVDKDSNSLPDNAIL